MCLPQFRAEQLVFCLTANGFDLNHHYFISKISEMKFVKNWTTNNIKNGFKQTTTTRLFRVKHLKFWRLLRPLPAFHAAQRGSPEDPRRGGEDEINLDMTIL